MEKRMIQTRIWVTFRAEDDADAFEIRDSASKGARRIWCLACVATEIGKSGFSHGERRVFDAWNDAEGSAKNEARRFCTGACKTLR